MTGLEKRSVSLNGHRTSIALEPEFWAVLESLARAETLPLAALLARIDAERLASERPLASALRVFALTHASSANTPLPSERQRP
jgi:predicted DNA-binding ribbon-helix-helix protein